MARRIGCQSCATQVGGVNLNKAHGLRYAVAPSRSSRRPHSGFCSLPVDVGFQRYSPLRNRSDTPKWRAIVRRTAAKDLQKRRNSRADPKLDQVSPLLYNTVRARSKTPMSKSNELSPLPRAPQALKIKRFKHEHCAPRQACGSVSPHRAPGLARTRTTRFTISCMVMCRIDRSNARKPLPGSDSSLGAPSATSADGPR